LIAITTKTTLFVDEVATNDKFTKNLIAQEDGSKTITETKNTISHKLTQSLDLEPLIQSVASHSGTKRGRDALLALLNKGTNQQKKRIELRNASKRKSLMSALDSNGKSSLKGVKNSQNESLTITRDMKHIVKLSQSSAECKYEWKLVEEAMDILTNTELSRTRLPPIYPGDSSPWDTTSRVDTDDDEWLIEILSIGWNGSLELEDILQADQVVNRILELSAWSIDAEVNNVAPSIAKICEDIDVDALTKVHEEIKESVTIVKGQKSYEDPSGTKVSCLLLP
jgi:hypothetical protein